MSDERKGREIEEKMKEYSGYCQVANREGMPKMYEFYEKKIKELRLIQQIIQQKPKKGFITQIINDVNGRKK